MRASSQQSDKAKHNSNRNLTSLIEGLVIAETTRSFDSRTVLWLALSLACSLVFAVAALRQAFADPYVIQDDARQHIFWTARFIDPGLFPNDMIADYFQSVAPAGYAALYHAAAAVGIDPFFFGKILPVALGLLMTLFCFGVSMQLLKIPSAAFIGCLILNQGLWMRNGIVSATPRAFISPLFLAFMFFLLRRSRVMTLVTIALMGLFFPSIMFIALGTLFFRLVRFENWKPRLSRDRRDYALCAAGLLVAALVLLPYAFKSSGFGPVVSASEGRAMPEFLPAGRMVVFRDDFWDYWITGSHTGMFSSALFAPVTMALGLLLPVVMFFPKWFPLAKRISSGINLLPRIIAASLFMFFAANVLLFRLYLPSRFTVNSFRILLAISAGLAAIIILDAVLQAAKRLSSSSRQLIAVASVAALFGVMLAPSLTGSLVDTRYKNGQAPRLYEFLSSQSKDVIIASLSDEADNLPTFARRPVLVGKETALPFHKGYYPQIRQRVVDLINAHYSASITDLQSFIQKYGVDYLLVDRDAFTPDYLARDKWLRQFQPAAKDALDRLKQGDQPALSKLINECSVLNEAGMTLIPAECILKAKDE